MSARIQADFLLIDRALRGGCSHRSSLKTDSLQAWQACIESLAAVLSFLHDGVCIFKSEDKSVAAVWVQWRKSNTSKQLLGLVKSVLEAAAAEASQRGASVRRCMAWMAAGLHTSITIASYFHSFTTYGVLWPALREWLVEQGGVSTMWSALTWDLQRACTGNRDIADTQALAILDSIGNVLTLSLFCPLPPPQPIDALLMGHSGAAATDALQLTLGKLIPAAFPTLQPSTRMKAVAFAHRIGFQCCSGSPAGGDEYLEPLHLPALRAWPYLVGAARHQISQPVQASEERENIQVRVHGGGAWGTG